MRFLRLAALTSLCASLFPSTGWAGDPAKGKEVFVPCSNCHDVEAGVRKRGPSLKNLFLREYLSNGAQLTPDNLRALIRDGYNGMPSYGVLISKTDFDDLEAFLMQYTERPGSEDGSPVEQGKKTFEAQCNGCHLADSAEKKTGPGLKGLFKREKLAKGTPVNDANVLSMIEDGGRGMPPFRESLSEDTRKALVAYLKTL